MLATTTVHALLSVAATLPYASEAQQARVIEAAKVAAAHDLDFIPLADEHLVQTDCLVPWTEEPYPHGETFTRVATVECEDGTHLCVYEGEAGIWIERLGTEEQDYRLLGRGFWRDCEPTEAVLFACEAWGC